MLIQGNCIDKMKELGDNSVDAVVTDPPYELGFMGKRWDASGIAYNVELWKEALRVLKPGGHLLSFGGTRTYHRMAVAIEDAGFEIRDMLEWIYASGFPKSQNVGKAFDKKMGNERDKVGYCKRGNAVNTDFMSGGNDITKGTSQWEGFGTALKPAHEPIVLARKPLSEKTIVENCIKHGTGALDIDGCRIPINDLTQEQIKRKYTGNNEGNKSVTNNFGVKEPKMTNDGCLQGRFPANLLVTDDALNDGEITKSSKFTNKKRQRNKGWCNSSPGEGVNAIDNFGDSGSKSRFFDIDVWGEKHGLIQCPKASKSERNAGCGELDEKENSGSYKFREDGSLDGKPTKPKANHHPTVKPLHLMSWLVRLVSKTGDTVLDPFMGSGTTGVACQNLNRKFIGIELDEEYIEIAEARIKKAETPLGL